MHRTQLYFDEALYKEIKQTASSMGITMSAYIRNVLKKELNAQKENSQPINFSEFAGMWKGKEITQKDLRNKAWK